MTIVKPYTCRLYCIEQAHMDIHRPIADFTALKWSIIHGSPASVKMYLQEAFSFDTDTQLSRNALYMQTYTRLLYIYR